MPDSAITPVLSDRVTKELCAWHTLDAGGPLKCKVAPLHECRQEPGQAPQTAAKRCGRQVGLQDLSRRTLGLRRAQGPRSLRTRISTRRAVRPARVVRA